MGIVRAQEKSILGASWSFRHAGMSHWRREVPGMRRVGD